MQRRGLLSPRRGTLEILEIFLHKNMENIDKYKVKKDVIRRGKKRCGRNDEIADYYLELGEKRRNPTLIKKYDHLRQCFKTWSVDYYKKQKVKDVKKVLRCKDIFCFNCQSQLAGQRYTKYVPFLEELSKVFDIYHVTHTVPNPLGPDLKNTVDNMYKKYAYINQYIQGKRKIKGIDFSHLGWIGTIRALEITSKITDKGIEYHPHFHSYMVLKKGLKNLTKPNIYNVNSFSFKEGKKGVQRFFSDFEILLQKIWYLVYNGIKVNRKNLAELTEGYSGIVEKCKPGKYHEVFKYVIKGTFKDSVFAYDYDSFRYLYDTLHGRRIINGYGAFRGFNFDSDEEEEVSELVEKEYSQILAELNAVESPFCGYDNVNDVLSNIGAGITYISKRKIAKDIFHTEEKSKRGKK